MSDDGWSVELESKKRLCSLPREWVQTTRTLFDRIIRRVMRSLGYDVISRSKYGYDPFLDIQKLSLAWGTPVNSFFDVGANDGQTSSAANRYFPGARICAFEPHSPTFERLAQRMARCSGFSCYNFALGSENGSVTFYEYDESVLNSLIPNAQYAVRFGKDARKLRARCVTLDVFCTSNEIKRIDVLKIDTEGFELEVMKGAANLLKTGAISFVYLEFNDVQPGENAAGGALGPVAQLLREYGVRFVASYNDYIVSEGQFFNVSNALFALAPAGSSSNPAAVK